MSKDKPLLDGRAVGCVHVYCMVYPGPLLVESEVNLMYAWVVEEKSTKGLEELNIGVNEQELRKRGELALEGPS